MKVGFCGLGLMGTPMVSRLLKAGHDVIVWNRTAAKAKDLVQQGAVLVDTPAELAERADTICLCLFDADAVEEVVFGLHGLAVSGRGGWLIDHSTIPADRTRQMAARLSASCDMTWIDAPVSGGVGGAQAGTLAIMAGGSAQAVRAVTPLLMAYAQRVTHMGAVGAGQITKLCNQAIVATTIAAIGEAVALARDGGVDPARLNEALAGGWADSLLLNIFIPRMLNPDTVKSAALNTMLKDLDAINALAQSQGTPVPVSASVQQTYRLAQMRGLGESDVSQLIQLYQPAR